METGRAANQHHHYLHVFCTLCVFGKFPIAKPLVNAYVLRPAQRKKHIRAQGKDFEKEGEVKPVTGPICAPVRFACITVGKTIAIPL